jgi:phosphate transport system substrate-binding protein
MQKGKLAVIVFMVWLVAVCNADADEVIKLSAAGSLQRGLFKKISEPFKKETGIDLKFNPSGTTLSINIYFQDLLAGRADAAVAPISWDDWKVLLNDEKVEIPKEVQITSRVVGKDLFDIFAQKGVNVKSLNQAQLEALFSGKIKSWKELGGPDIPVVVVLANDRAATKKSFNKLVMSSTPFASNAKSVDTANTQRVEVGKTPGAVAFDSQVPDSPNYAKISIPPLGKPATMVTVGRPSDKVEKLIKFMREREAKGQ